MQLDASFNLNKHAAIAPATGGLLFIATGNITLDILIIK
jgi:hypothetical protein